MGNAEGRRVGGRDFREVTFDLGFEVKFSLDIFFSQSSAICSFASHSTN